MLRFSVDTADDVRELEQLLEAVALVVAAAREAQLEFERRVYGPPVERPALRLVEPPRD